MILEKYMRKLRETDFDVSVIEAAKRDTDLSVTDLSDLMNYVTTFDKHD